MILFFPQWQGAGRNKRIDRPARVLFKALLDPVYERSGATDGHAAPVNIVEVPVETDDNLALEQGIWGRGVLLHQLRAAREVLAQYAPDRVFTVGGDCGIEVSLVGYLNDIHDDFALVWIDAHADLNTPETSPSGTFHGMPLRVLMGEGDPEFTALVPKPLTPEQVLMVGVRNADPGEQEFIDRVGIRNLAVGTEDLPQLLPREITAHGVRNIYIHVDLDALDPVQWPHMHYPELNGFSIEALTEFVSALCDEFNVVGMSITEYDSGDGKGLDALKPLFNLFAQLHSNQHGRP